ncbi:alpha/beta hydrolase [Bacillus sp. SM2101]|uniref:alpha/beta hydrolase n=1 Tax=Bacillaceae TaxID=186817 RepID=UPI001BDF1EC8|nr:alpha/beta hydrolase [Bacillus sp. SM2101]
MRLWHAEQPLGVIVIIHGACEHIGRYKWLLEMWRSIGMHVAMGDLPGQGTSRRRHRGHIDSFDDYIEEIEMWVQEALTFKLPVFILGHSMGGLVAIRAMQEKQLPIHGLMLSSPCLGLVEHPPKGLEWVSKGLNYLFPEKLFEAKLSAEIATRNKDIQEQDNNDSLYVTKVSVRWYHELLKAMKLAYRNIHKLPDVPLLLMQGGSDKIVDKVVVKEWFDHVKCTDKTYKEWIGLYHEIFNEPERENVFNFAKSFVEKEIKLYENLN